MYSGEPRTSPYREGRRGTGASNRRLGGGGAGAGGAPPTAGGGTGTGGGGGGGGGIGTGGGGGVPGSPGGVQLASTLVQVSLTFAGSNNGNGNGGGREMMAQQQNGKPMPPQLDHNSTKELNLTVLQRMDRHVEDILTTAAHVTFYQFDVDASQWSRKDVEGSLFVVKRRTQPRFQFIVMNRRSTDNLVENLLGDFEYEVQSPYLLYRNAAQEVNGIWFYNTRECEDVANLFSRILSAFNKPPPKSRLIPSSSEFQELEAVPNSSIVEGPLERGPLASPSLPDIQDEPLERFFNPGRINTSDNTAPTGPRPSTSHSLPSRSPLSAPMAMSQIISPTTQALPLTSLTTPLSLDTPDIASAVRATLVKPSFFVPPPLTSAPSAPPLASSMAPMQPSHGAPLLQPFPPPNPPLSLAPTMQHSMPITRDGVREALNRLLKNDQFIDMVYREMVAAHAN